MIYAAFTFWLLLIVFTGIGLHRLWGRLAKPSWANWAVLPGTVVSEMAYIFGCLITGGEIRRAKLMPGKPAGKGQAEAPSTESSGGLKWVGPVVASLLAIVACAGAILLLRRLLGETVMEQFSRSRDAQLSKHLPRSTGEFWEQLGGQVHLLRRMCQTWGELDWLSWRVPLFVYLAACFSVRIAPASRQVRPALAAAVLAAALIGLTGLISRNFANLMADLWPLLSYVWASLLLLLALTLLAAGAVKLVNILAGKDK